MIDMQTIQAAVARLAAAASSPSRVILFGSYGRGTADDGSDLDLMVIRRNCRTKRRNTCFSWMRWVASLLA